MDSLRAIPFDPASDVPLYQQLYLHLRRAILSGELKGRTKLPSTRSLAEDLNLSRNTILTAYRQLTAEGYLESIEGSGSFVVHTLPDDLLAPPEHGLSARAMPVAPRQPRLSEHAR